MASGILNKDINLLPKYKAEEANKIKSSRLILYALISVLILLVAIASISVRNYYTLAENKMGISEEISKLEAIKRKAEELERIKAAIDSREKYQNNIDKTNTSMIKLLDFLEKENSNGIYLTGLSDSADRAGSKQITIIGAATSKEVIADFQYRLKDAEMFSTVFLPSLTQADKADFTSVFGDVATNIPLVKFSIICVLI